MISPTSPYRQLGDTTLEVYVAEFERVNSPMLAEAAAIHQAASPHSALFLAMAWIENQYATTGIIIKPEHHNPMSLRPWTDDPNGMPPGAVGVTTASDGGQYLRFARWTDCVREWKRRLFDDPNYKEGVYTTASTLAEMLNTYAPPGDVHPDTGLPNEDIKYAEKVAELLTRFGAEVGEEVVEPSVDTNRHIYALSAGHRNSQKGGATGEYEWTMGATRALADALRAQGATVYIAHEADGDDEPDLTRGDREKVARVVCEIDRKHGPLTAYISMHYNGGGAAGFHAIFPDGWDDGDEKANNPLDVKLARAIRDRVVATNTVKALHWTADSAGVMSEHESGAVSGAYGARLGKLLYTKTIRDHAVRLILEAGSIDTFERKYITNPAWVSDVYCKAIVDGLRDVFGPFPAEVDGTQVEEPKPPTSVYVEPIERPWVEELRAGKSSVRLPDANHPQGFVTWFAVNRMYRAKTDVARQQVATDDSQFVNEPVPAGTAVMIDAVGTNWEGDAYGLSPWGTMFRLDDLEPLPWPEMADVHSRVDDTPDTPSIREELIDLRSRSDQVPDLRAELDGLQDPQAEPEQVPG